VRTAASILLHYGPALAAIVVAGAAGGRRGIGRLLRPLGHWRVGVGWYVFVLLFPLGVRLAATGLNLLLGGSPPSFFAAGAESGVPAGVHPLLLLVPVFLGVFLQAGIAEEIGWRGFALPRLQARFGALTSSLILGLLWAVWHFDPQRGPALLERGVLYPLAVLAMTVLMTWVYNSTGGSLLLVVLYHTASNVSDWIAPTANLAGAQAVAGGRPFALQVR
jgi:membrane protease YdiL (CAAX protease family)